MSVNIKGMKMPRCCDECQFRVPDNWYGASCSVAVDESGWSIDITDVEDGERHPDCPLSEVEEEKPTKAPTPVSRCKWIEMIDWNATAVYGVCPECGYETKQYKSLDKCPKCGTILEIE